MVIPSLMNLWHSVLFTSKPKSEEVNEVKTKRRKKIHRSFPSVKDFNKTLPLQNISSFQTYKKVIAVTSNFCLFYTMDIC